MAVFVTGDTHAEFERFNSKRFHLGKTLTENDYVIIAGDFGGFWDGSEKERRNLKRLADKPWTTLFIDGNHENFDLLESEPEIDKFGGKVGDILGGKIYHLKRGYIYTIDDKNIFTFGGGLSVDKHFRKEGRSWWSREYPNAEEIDRAWESLKSDKHIDYVITHTAPTRYISRMFGDTWGGKKISDITALHLQDFADYIRDNKSIKRWFYGHFHYDIFEEDIVGLYYAIVNLEDSFNKNKEIANGID